VHFLSCSEDGICLIWDTRAIDKGAMREAREKAKNQKYDYEWIPWLAINLFRQDGSGEVGLSRVLFQKSQETPTFFASSDEGDLFMIDWAVKPIGEDQKNAEFIRMTKDCERNYRPVVALERSPFFEELIMTVHDFHFAIWKTQLDQETPIYRSANTFESHNTCGAFSPTRPGVIFITKTNGIDVWDFVDQSNKPSLTLNIATNPITTFKFQHIPDPTGKGKHRTQYMAYGDKGEGTLYLYEVPNNLRNAQDNEVETIKAFFDKEIEKCEFIRTRRVTMREEWDTKERQKMIAQAKAEAEKEQAEDAEQEREMAEEAAYQEYLLVTK